MHHSKEEQKVMRSLFDFKDKTPVSASVCPDAMEILEW